MIPLFKPYIPENLEEGIREILYSGKLAFGEWGQKFEEKLGNYLGTKSVVLVNSYSSALNVALETLNINAEDEIIMSPMCCLQSTQPLLARNINIIWGDIDPTTGTLDPESVKNKISPKTKAIFHNQHLGYVGYINEINSIGEKYGVFTIDDCVDGLGGELKNNKIGNVGSDVTVLSFHAVRLPNGIESGGITFKDGKFLEKAKMVRDLGINRSYFRDYLGEINENYDISIRGFGATANEISSYIAFNQMDKLDYLIEKQRLNAEHWTEFLISEGIDAAPLNLVEDSKPSYWVYGILTQNKMELLRFFREQGYHASGIHLNNDRYSVFRDKSDLPGVKKFYSQFLGLPTGWWFTK